MKLRKAVRVQEGLKGRAPVHLSPAYPVAPHPVFRSDVPLLLIRANMKYIVPLLYRWRADGLEKLEPVDRVRAVDVNNDVSTAVVFDIYPLSFPLEELLFVVVYPYDKASVVEVYMVEEGAAPLFPPHGAAGVRAEDLLEEEVRKAVERELGVKVWRVHLYTSLSKLTPNPAETLFHKGLKKSDQLVPVVQPGWATIVGPLERVYASSDGINWYPVQINCTELSRDNAAYVPEGSYFIAFATVPGRLLPHLEVPWSRRRNPNTFVIIPLAWHLPEARLPEPVKKELLALWEDPELAVEPTELILETVGAKWP